MTFKAIRSMSASSIQDVLACVEKPSRYLGTEMNRVLKAPDSVDLKIALAFPDLYEIGTSHFGIQILYHILNKRPDIAAERVFAPAGDLEKKLRELKIPLSTLESGTPLAEFDMVGFSLLYELNFTNVLNMLDLAGLQVRSAARKPDDPLIIAGGPCVCNPEPMSDFFDAMVFGDGETVVLEMADAWLCWKSAGGKDKNQLLRLWSKIRGVYIPAFFKPNYDRNGFQRLEPLFEDYIHINRAIVTDLDNADFPDQPVVPFGRPVHDRLRLEISRGCSRGCRFCQAGMIYRPVRERSAEKLLSLFEASLAATGYEDLSLLSLSTGDYTCLAPLMENLMERCRKELVALSLPSIRAGTLTPNLMSQIKRVRKTGFTIAPEAGSQRLRDAINKNVCYEDIADTVRDAFALGWQVIKLYFMIGLPTETQDDIEAVIAMVKELKTIKGPAKRRGQINVSVTTFIPKPHTPFQWSRQIPTAESMDKIEVLKSGLNKLSGIQVKWQAPNMSQLEGVLARGDRRVSKAIEKAWQCGCRFDGWTDQFDFKQWQAAFEFCKVDMGFYTTRSRQVDEPLPWDHMLTGASKDFFKDQWAATHTGEKLDDCRHGHCHQCGICDFETIEPKIFTACPVPEKFEGRNDTQVEGPFCWLALTYTKLDQARLFGHLEQAKIFARALRRAKIKVQYSRGFHPMPKISFDDPLPLGMESEAEHMKIFAATDVSCDRLVDCMNAYLPPGLQVAACEPVVTKKIKRPPIDCYRIFFGSRYIDRTLMDDFKKAGQWPHIPQRNKIEMAAIDLKEFVHDLCEAEDNSVYLAIHRKDRRIVRPAEVLKSVFRLNPDELALVRTRKLANYR